MLTTRSLANAQYGAAFRDCNGGIDGQNDAAHVRFEKTPTGMCDSVQYPSRVACALGTSGNHLRVLGLPKVRQEPRQIGGG